ncbi:MAG: hypothetical protein ACJ8CR_29575 [Roseiflexaceae bacterium]
MLAEEIERQEELLTLMKRRKHELDKQAALFGASSDPAINLQRQDLARDIVALEKEIEALRQKLLTTSITNTVDKSTASPDNAILVADKVYDKKSLGKERTNMISAVVCFVIAFILLIWPQSLGAPTVGIAGFLGLFGFFALGLALDQHMGKDSNRDIFGGIGFLFVPASIYYYIGLNIWSIVPLTFLVLLAVVGINSGIKKRKGRGGS